MKSAPIYCFILTVLIALSSTTANAQETRTNLATGETGRFAFHSANHQTSYLDIFKQQTKLDETIIGELNIPANAEQKSSAMIIMHGSAGLNVGTSAWTTFLNQLGIITFVVDSFTSRGFQQTATDQSLLSYPASVVDGLQALQLLATHPRIDTNRIGILGFSRGGVAAQNASFERIRSAVIPDDLKFALHISFYGDCTRFAKTTGSPILFLAGDKDDFFSLERCLRNIDLLKSKGANLKVIVYPGATHGFDVPGRTRNVYAAQAQTWKNCDIETDIDTMTTWLNGSAEPANRQDLVNYYKSCMSRGVTLATNSLALEKSRAEVKAFVTEKFGLNR